MLEHTGLSVWGEGDGYFASTSNVGHQIISCVHAVASGAKGRGCVPAGSRGNMSRGEAPSTNLWFLGKELNSAVPHDSCREDFFPT